jgi:hypothetical protein
MLKGPLTPITIEDAEGGIISQDIKIQDMQKSATYSEEAIGYEVAKRMVWEVILIQLKEGCLIVKDLDGRIKMYDPETEEKRA